MTWLPFRLSGFLPLKQPSGAAPRSHTLEEVQINIALHIPLFAPGRAALEPGCKKSRDRESHAEKHTELPKVY